MNNLVYAGAKKGKIYFIKTKQELNATAKRRETSGREPRNAEP